MFNLWKDYYSSYINNALCLLMLLWFWVMFCIWVAYIIRKQGFYLNSLVDLIIISQLMFKLLGHRPSLWITHKENVPGPSADWWMQTTANAAGTNGLTCLPKHEGIRDNKFLVTHPMTDQRCLTSAIAHWSALTVRPSGSSDIAIGIGTLKKS
jgi:hypothetical protein